MIIKFIIMWNYDWIYPCKFCLLIFKMSFVMMSCSVDVQQTIVFLTGTIPFSLLYCLMHAFLDCFSPLIQVNCPGNMSE